MPRILVLMACGLLGAGGGAAAQRLPVSAGQAAEWARHTIPLPHQMEIAAKVVVPRGRVAVVAPESSALPVAQAVRELREAVGRGRSGTPAGSAAFTLTLELGGSRSAALATLKNRGQAYGVASDPGGRGLRLTAPAPPGLYYAAKTLQQLIAAYSTPERVEIPLARITDWPDLEERGLWGTDNFAVLPWMADRKLNYVEQISAIGVDEKGKGWGRLKPDREPLHEEGPRYAMRPVPVVLHLEQVSDKGVFAAYPNLKAKGGQTGAICYAQPQIVGILSDWIAELYRIPNAAAVDVWMTENLHGQGGCRCDECRKVDRSVQEARVILQAWARAKERVGRDIPLYVLSSEETVRSNALVLEELPRDVRFWYYQWLTYRTSESPMIPGDIAAAAARGQWVGVVPNIDASTHFLGPFVGARFMRYRMNEFVDKGLRGVMGYTTPRVLYSRRVVEAAAEYAWNARGRTPEEFLRSHAVREGMKDPEKWTRWANLIDPVEWDVYGSDYPAGAQRRNPAPVAQRLKEGTLQELGTAVNGVFPYPWGDIKSEAQLREDVADAGTALALAREMGVPEYVYESLVAQGYIRSIAALWDLKRLVVGGAVAPEKRGEAQAAFRAYGDGLQQASDSLPKWLGCVRLREDTNDWTEKPRRVIGEMREQMAQVAAELGLGVPGD